MAVVMGKGRSMNQLTASDRALLSKLLGMTGSNHDGEVIAAARKAAALVQSRGMTWPVILGVGDASPPTAPEPDHVTEARDMLGKGRGICTRWEMDFLRGILAFKALSPYQRQTLDGIREKVLAALDAMETNLHTE